MTEPTKNNTRRHSAPVVDGPGKAASRAMLRAVGFNDDDFQKPQVGIASTWSMVTPCNSHIGELAELARDGAMPPEAKAWCSIPLPFLMALPTAPKE